MGIMSILVLAKLQLACLTITVFVGIMYFCSNREKSKLNNSFSRILITLPIYLVCDIATVISVNKIRVMPHLNDIFHRFFFITLILTVFFFCNHMYTLIEAEIGSVFSRKPQKIFAWITLVGTVFFSLFQNPAYSQTEITGFAVASFAGGAFLAVFIYSSLIIFALIKYWKILPVKKKRAITTALVIEIVGLYCQMMHTELLLSGFVLTMMMLAFYITLENPDAILLEQIKVEKEKAEAANASKSAFVSMVSHEIRTPMNAVVGMTDILIRDGDNLRDRQKEYLHNIKTSGESLVMIVNDILDQSKIEAGKMELVNEEYNLTEIVGDVTMIIENRVGDKPVRVGYDIDSKVPSNLVGDGLRIRQILINLMNNAVKFTDEGYVKLCVSAMELEESSVLLKFGVKDSGQGIRQEDLEKLGQAFTQVDTTKNHKKEGTGLGLSISRDLISLMGGKLDVRSEYGKGSEFYFSVWQDFVVASETDNFAEGAEQEAAAEFTVPDAKILVVDDTFVNLIIVEELLDPVGGTVTKASSGEEAIELIKDSSFDIIFMDYLMPDMDGTETTRRIREASNGAAVPIVALTGDTSQEARELFEQCGMNDFMEKPVEYEGLCEMLRKWLPQELINYN